MVSIIVPVYNERDTIDIILLKLSRLRFDKEIIVIDDGSTDGTAEVLRFCPSNVRTIFHPKNYGKGRAIRSGLRVARGHIVVIQDADLEYDPKDMRKVLQPIWEFKAEVVYGNRFNGMPTNMKFPYKLANRFLTKLTNLATGLRLSDMETGYKVFKRKVIDEILLKQNRFGFEPEVTVKLAKAGYKIKEVPISYSARTKTDGKKIGLRNGLNVIWCILRYANGRYKTLNN